VTVDAPDRQVHVVPTKRAVPGDRVVVVGVDERAVDVEDGCGRHRLRIGLRGDPRDPALGVLARRYLEPAVRPMFVIYLTLVVAGITYFMVIGLSHH
jgi:hypothetical protein